MADNEGQKYNLFLWYSLLDYNRLKPLFFIIDGIMTKIPLPMFRRRSKRARLNNPTIATLFLFTNAILTITFPSYVLGSDVWGQ